MTTGPAAEDSAPAPDAAAVSGDLSGPGDLPAYDDLPDGLVVADHARRVIVFNRAAQRITGLSSASALGKDLDDALPLEGLDGRLWWPCARPYDGLSTVTGHPERNLLLPGGHEVLVTARYVRAEPRGVVQRVVVGLRDTRHRAREELSRAELVSTVAHELRSPLTSVKGFTATLLAKWDRFNDDQKRLMLETVNADADRVTRLITELLDIARIDSGRLAVRRQIVDLPRVVARHVAAMVAAGETEHRFDVQLHDGIPEMWVDADKLDQVLGNLLENAVRHGSGKVTIVAEPEGDGAAVTVMDEGEGIPDEQRDRVFTRFWRSGRRGGTGLGLYIVRGLVEAHGGHIEVGQAPGGGARFRFVLPAAAPDFAD
ncbi:MAG: PAS domain-containing protein [Sporichthyaceae bacterium]|nr:PAS domain-containing protein [Sporichthyaceae bacterium]